MAYAETNRHGRTTDEPAQPHPGSSPSDRCPESPDGRTTERAAWIYDWAVSSLTMKSTVQGADNPARIRIFAARRKFPPPQLLIKQKKTC